MNLKAPIIVNMNNRKAAQIILDTDKYTVRHFILDELRKQEV
jgi:flagellar assembly factor FliW